MGRLENKVVVITGGNSGIGLATAKRVVEEGGRVAIFGRDQKTVDGAVSELGERAIGVRGDVTRREDLDRLFAETTKRFGAVDALFVNAGVATPLPFAEMTPEAYDHTFDINVKGAYFTLQAALPHLAKGGASILFNTSAIVTKGLAGMSVYAATKAALRSMVRTLAVELQPIGHRVNAVAPGPIETPIYERLGLPAEVAAEFGKQVEADTPIGRFGRASEIAEPAVFLLSDESSYVLGAEFAVDGGFAQV
ncbi:MAG: SDR family oxidoreductase [Planctomycetota bacterium]